MNIVSVNDKIKASRADRGFSVIELLVAMAAVALVILVAVPGSSALIEKYRLKSASKDLLSGLAIARAESEARSSTVRVCPSSNGHTCRSDGNWNLGWLVYSDGNGDGRVQDIEVIQAFEPPNPKIHIVASGAVQSRASFTTTGLVQERDASTGEFLICHAGSGAPARKVRVDSDGWFRSIPLKDMNC